MITDNISILFCVCTLCVCAQTQFVYRLSEASVQFILICLLSISFVALKQSKSLVEKLPLGYFNTRMYR